MRFDVVTLFPEFIEAAAGIGVVGRAATRGLIEIATWNPRDYTNDPGRRVDARPFGGGPGMVMQAEPLQRTVAAAQSAADGKARVLCMTPQGARLTQERVAQLAREPRLLVVCGRYEGIDERWLATEVDEELSIGDYVLSGGELAAAVLIDAIGRLQSGALGHADSAAQDSFAEGLLDHPHYARPEMVEEVGVPPVLMSGDHAAIARWRKQQALGRTWLRRPELLARRSLDAEERSLLEEFRREFIAAQDR
ncbi:MAG: tRNA (guanosine(37)-N1)-methyltransferase TrmD [Lysobacterales bacterium]